VSAYYNEHDKFAAAWLRELIADGLIAPGEVDERDIQDVTPNELRSFRQVHLFAGIGIWSAACAGAGWPDDREAWTVSCPCQPFSAAGQRAGFADERHLWPSAYHLIGQCRPPVVFGEQSSSKDGLAWFDLVSADMEAADYAGGALDLCSAGFGAPNIRQRNYFVWLADANGRADHKDGPECLNVPGRTRLAGWPTPSRARSQGTLNALLLGLCRVAWLAGWPTPMAGTPAQKGYNEAGNTDSGRKTQAIAKAAFPARLTASGEMLTGSSAETLMAPSGAPLNPEHSLWLQGIPRVWLSCADRATLSIKKSRKASSKPS
jgi:DNA (cytosine-5)-methyltransferase 1